MTGYCINQLHLCNKQFQKLVAENNHLLGHDSGGQHLGLGWA